MCPNHGAVDMKVQKSAAQCEKPFVRQPWTFIVTDEDVAWMANSAAARASEIGPQFDTEVFTTKRPKITVRRSNVLARTVKTKRTADVSRCWHWPIHVYPRIVSGDV